jgi:hypothetical protein
MEKSAAFYAGVESALEKEALFGFGKLKPKAPLKMSFKGHSKALGLGTTKTPAGVVTKRTMGPGGLKQTKHVTGVSGWTQ